MTKTELDGIDEMLEQCRLGLQEQKLYVVARATGISYPTLKKLHDGEEHNFTVDTLKAVLTWIEQKD